MIKKSALITAILLIVFMISCNLDDIDNGSTDDALVAAFSTDENTGDSPLIIRFDASTSKCVNGTIEVYSWNYGDGEHGEGMQIAHTYLKPGTFVVSLTITDDKGNSDVATKNIVVTPGAVIFVDASYSGDNSDGSESNPYKTISKAMEIVSDGQTINVKAGTYNESFDLIGGIKLIGESKETVILEPDSSVGINIEDLMSSSEISGMTISKASNIGIKCGIGAEVQITDMLFTDNKTGLNVENNSDPVITRCSFTENEKAIIVENNSSPEISECTIENNWDGIVIDNNASPQILNNTIRDNENMGIKVENYSNPTIDGNEISSNGKRGINITIYSIPFLANNTLSANTEFDVRCGDEYSDYEDQGGNSIDSCSGCEACGQATVIEVEGRYEGSGVRQSDGRTVVRAIEIDQDGVNLTIRIFNQEDGGIPPNPNDHAEAKLTPGENSVTFTSNDRGDEWELEFGDDGTVTGKQTIASNGNVIDIVLNII